MTDDKKLTHDSQQLNTMAAILMLKQWSIKRIHKCFHIPNCDLTSQSAHNIKGRERLEISWFCNESCLDNAGKWRTYRFLLLGPEVAVECWTTNSVCLFSSLPLCHHPLLLNRIRSSLSYTLSHLWLGASGKAVYVSDSLEGWIVSHTHRSAHLDHKHVQVPTRSAYFHPYFYR